MKFLDRIGLSKSIEISTCTDANAFEQQLLNFKESKKDKLGFLYATSFIPLELTIKNGEFILTKFPRFFNPLATVGEVRGQLTPNDRNAIEARVFSTFYLLIFMLTLSIIIGVFAIYVSHEQESNFIIFWLMALASFNILIYQLLRYSVKRLEREFRIFMNEQILNKAP